MYDTDESNRLEILASTLQANVAVIQAKDNNLPLKLQIAKGIVATIIKVTDQIDITYENDNSAKADAFAALRFIDILKTTKAIHDFATECRRGLIKHEIDNTQIKSRDASRLKYKASQLFKKIEIGSRQSTISEPGALANSRVYSL